MTDESQPGKQYIAPVEVSPEESAIEAAFGKLHGEFYRHSERLATLTSNKIEARLNLLRTINGFEDVTDVSDALDRVYSIMEDEYTKYCEDPSHDFRSTLEFAESVLVALVGEDPKEFSRKFQETKEATRAEEEWANMTEEQRQQIIEEEKQRIEAEKQRIDRELYEYMKREIAEIREMLKKT